MIFDVVNREKNLARSETAKNNKFLRGTSLFHSLRSFHTILRMICLQLVLAYLMMKVAMMILLLNLHMQNKRDMSTMMSHQRLRQLHCHQRQQILLQRELQCHQIVLQREQAHIQMETTLAILSGIGTRITVLIVQSLIENYMPLHVGVIINHQFTRSCLRSVSV